MNDWARAGAFEVNMHNKGVADRAARSRDEARNSRDEWRAYAKGVESACDSWTAYAKELEELVIELGSRLEATCQLTEQILRAANGEPVEHADKLLSPAGEDIRRAMLDKAQQQSKTGMAQAHQERLKENPDAVKKERAINKTYAPNSERAAKLWGQFLKVKASRDGNPALASNQGDLTAMRELLLEIGPELKAANNLVLRLLAEGNGHDVTEKLLPAANYDERKAYLNGQVKESREGMVHANLAQIKSMVSPSAVDSPVARQKEKIAIAPVARGRKM